MPQPLTPQQQQQVNNLYTQAQGLQQQVQTYAQNNPQNPGSAGVLAGANPLGSPTLPASINSTTTQPQPGLTLPTPGIPTAGAGLQGTIEQMAIDQQKKIEADTLAKNNSKSDLDKTIQTQLDTINAGNEESLALQEKNSPELLAKQKASQDLNNQIIAEQRALKLQRDALFSNGGLTKEQAQAQYSELERQSVSKQADLSLTKLVADTDLNQSVTAYNTAQDLITKKIDMRLEPLKIMADYQKNLYEINKADLSKSEDRQFQLLMKKTDNELETQKTALTNAHNDWLNATKNGMPQDVSKQVLDAINSGDYQKAEQLLSQYQPANKLDTQIVEVGGRKILYNTQTGEEIKDLGGIDDGSTPTIKSINGTDMQWNATTKQWENLPGEGASTISPYQQERITRNLMSISDLEKRVDSRTVGILTYPFPNFPGSVSRDFRADLETLKANITFGELTAMREASKTGGALGQISDRENQLLGAALGSLDPGQTPANFKKNLQKIKDSINRWKTAVNQFGYNPGKTVTAPNGEQIVIVD